MVTVNLYQPGKIDCNIPFPESWNELLPEELLIICRRQLQKFNTIYEQLAAIFQDFISLRSKKENLPDNFFELIDIDDASAYGLPLVDFIYKDNLLTNQLFPVLKIKRKSFHGPLMDFNSITCGEFEDTEIFFSDFIEDPRREPLAHLAAILWRPAGKDYMYFSAKKNKWLTYDHEKTVKRFLLLSEEQLYAIFIWYSGCRRMMPLYFPTVYENNGDTNAEHDVMVFTKCIHSGAGAKNGSRTDIRRTLLKEFFTEMELEAIHMKKVLKENQNANS